MKTPDFFLIIGIVVGLAAGCKEHPKANPVEATFDPAQSQERAAYPETAFEPAQKADGGGAALPGTTKYLDAKNGFRDVTFGQSDSSIPNLVLKSSDDARNLKTYMRADENLSLNGVPLKSIDYTFLKGELFRIVVKWSVEEKGAVLRNSGTTSLAPFCARLYGPAKRHSVKKDGAEYVWRGKHVDLILNETRLPGVPDAVHGGWAMTPSTKGDMVIESIDRRKALGADTASATAEKKDGL